MSDPTKSPDTCSVISLPASLGGPSPWPLPDGRVIDPCGLAVALASLSARQVKALGLQISGISGLHGSISSASADLQRSLESKLRQRLDMRGSMECVPTWKDKVTPSGRQYCQLVPQARRTDAIDSGSLPTPSGTSNHGRNHVAGRLDEWGGSSNPFRGTSLGRVHCPAFELWVMGYSETWAQRMPLVMPSSRKSRRSSSPLIAKPDATPATAPGPLPAAAPAAPG